MSIDTPDRTDAIARVILGDVHHYGAVPSHQAAERLLTTDDPAAVAAIADQWAEHHPDTLLDALTKAGVLHEIRGRGDEFPNDPGIFTGPHAPREVTP